MPGDERTKDATWLINAWARGDASAADDLFRVLSDELAKLAKSAFGRDSRLRDELEPAGLISEAFLKLDKYFKSRDQVEFPNRKAFYAVALRTMRHLLLDLSKRGGADRPRRSRIVSVGHADDGVATRTAFDAVDFYATLDRLRARNAEHAEALERHYILGQTLSEVAEEMGLATATVKRRLVAAKQWFEVQLRGAAQAAPAD